jgi:hypothetical protein
MRRRSHFGLIVHLGSPSYLFLDELWRRAKTLDLKVVIFHAAIGLGQLSAGKFHSQAG